MRLRKTLLSLSLALLTTVTLVSSPQTGPAKLMLEAAKKKEVVDGDLNAAIQQYKAVVAKYPKEPAVVADALIHMAECYQKLGNAESQKVYQRIVKEFADQKDASALAQARLGGTAGGRATRDVRVWTGPNVDATGAVSPDGRFITYMDWNGDDRLMVHDVAANVDRALTPPPVDDMYGSLTWSRISSDSKQVVFGWWNGVKKGDGLRIAALQGSGIPESRQFFLHHDDVVRTSALDWSPDGKWIAEANQLKDGTGQILLIGVADGSYHVLKSINSNLRPANISFSVDGKYIAYDFPAADTSQRDVFVIAIDGSREGPAVVHNAVGVIGWSPDGTRLLFSSGTRSVGLWALTLVDGKAQGTPELLKSDFGSGVTSLGMTVSGALYYEKRVSTRDLVIAPIDLAAGRLVGPPVGFTQGFVEGALYPQWSRDAKYLAYPACNNSCIAIRSVATGQVRVLPSTLKSANTPNWSPDGRWLLVHGSDLTGHQGIFQIDPQSGEAKVVILGDGISALVQWSPDGKKVYFNRNNVFVERDIASGVEREVYREAGTISPNGQYFYVVRSDSSAKATILLVMPITGGEPREILRLSQPEKFGWGEIWAPDSSAIVFDKNTGDRRELWLAPINGVRPHKLDIDPEIWLKGAINTGQRGFSLSPDGHSIAFQMGEASEKEVWALENFLPVPAAKK